MSRQEIQEEHQQQMKALATAIDELLNLDRSNRTVGFVLLVYPLNSSERSDRINYLSNSRREDVLVALKELVARFEGRAMEAPEVVQ